MTASKKILFFGIKTFPSRGGTDRVAENLPRHLGSDFDLTLFCLRGPGEPAASSPSLRIVRFTPILRGSVGTWIYLLRSTIRALFMDFDLIHVHKTECAFFIPLLRIRHRVIATSHEAPYLRDKWNAVEKGYFRLAERWFIRTPHLITCISEPLTRYYQNRYGREVFFIPNGIDVLPRRAYDDAGAERAIGADSGTGKPFILFAARRLMATKGCHTMLEALRKISYRGRIFIAGEINHHSGYMQRLNRLAEGLDVRFIGFIHPVEKMLALVAKSELFIFPSETEGMSIMLLEAASAGAPVIASDIPENRIFTTEELLFFKNRSADDLAEKITYALANPQSMAERSRKAREAAENRYAWAWIAQAYKNLYLEMLGHPRMAGVPEGKNDVATCS